MPLQGQKHSLRLLFFGLTICLIEEIYPDLLRTAMWIIAFVSGDDKATMTQQNGQRSDVFEALISVLWYSPFCFLE